MANTTVLVKSSGRAGSRFTMHRVGGEREPLARDILDGLSHWRLWMMLGWEDIRQRYRRSVLGPFWITLSMGTLIGLLGIIYSRIFRMDIAVYLPYFAIGYILWGFISGTVNESCGAFQEGERIIKQVKWPLSLYVLRVLWRNFIVFLHTIVIFIPIAIYFGIKPQPISLLVIPGFLLLYANQVWLGLVLAIFSTRFRDVVPIVTTIVQIALFATPIMYPVSTLGDLFIIAKVNPLYHFIDIVRAPLLDQVPSTLSWVVAVSVVVVGWVCAILLFRRVSRRIVYWL